MPRYNGNNNEPRSKARRVMLKRRHEARRSNAPRDGEQLTVYSGYRHGMDGPTYPGTGHLSYKPDTY